MNKILEANKDDRFMIRHDDRHPPTGPWKLQEVAEILETCFTWMNCKSDHTIELIEVTN